MNRIQGAGVVGITSTIPIEIVFAAGLRPVDLNNRFITHPDRGELVAEAEAAGFPLNFCAWIKGIYSLVRRGGIDRVIGVVQGDCSNTELLLEIFQEEGVEVIPFEYPPDRDPRRLAGSLEALSERLGTSLEAAQETRLRMRGVREKLAKLDWMTWHEGRVSGFENHLWLINSSDMRGDWRVYEGELDEFLASAARREPAQAQFRLGFAGIPPIADGLYEILEEMGAAVVFNEFQRQFSMPGPRDSLVDEYLAYTYPYGTRMRIADIRQEVATRRIDGLIHYIQSFCYRQLQDRAIRRACGVPVLSLEFDRPGRPGGRSLTRMEAFMELLEGRRRRQQHSCEGRI
ncbi:MAG: 2-hydroxyacyl-CoA dehydratase [Planctomycetes bacterium]|nr:2-hydroxyacyl-CoA dehydratase [Planctomycetota bacterium]